MPIAWKVLLFGGLVNVFFSIVVPFQVLFTDPTATYGSQDVLYVGKTWDEIVAFSPALGHWITYMMVSMCSMMMGFGVLVVGMAANAFRRGERWAWVTAVVANLLVYAYTGGLTLVYLRRGLYGFSSGFSIGLKFLIAWTIALVIALWLPRKEFR